MNIDPLSATYLTNIGVANFLIPSGMATANKTPDTALKDWNGRNRPPAKKKVTIARLLGSNKYAVYLDCVPGTTSFEIAGEGETENIHPSREEITRMISDFEAAAAVLSKKVDEDFDTDKEVGIEKEQVGADTEAATAPEKDTLGFKRHGGSGHKKNSSLRLAKMLELTKMRPRKKKRTTTAFVQPKIRKPAAALAKKW